MSHTFNKELHTAIKEVYTELESKELIQKNLEKGAKLGLYYAHGATEKADNKLETNQDKSKVIGKELKEATNATEVCANIVTAATTAAKDALNTNSAASTAAVNIQSAADSLTELSADVAAILAVATAKDCGSKIQKLANMANEITRSAAKKAENTTLQSLNTTIEAAQSRAAVSLSQAKTLSTDIIALNKALNDNFEALQTKISEDSSALATAISNENQQAGIYQIALEEEKAMRYSEEFINKKVNYDLKYIPVGNQGEQFDISFNSFDAEKFVLLKGILKEEWVLSEYRIIFTTLDDAAAFDIHAAKATSYYSSFSPKTKADPSTDPPTDPIFDLGPYIRHFHTTQFDPTESTDNNNVAVDNTGQAVKRGVPYVAFVYVVYTCPYQNEMDNTDGYLSLPSLPFTLQTELPAAEKPRLHFYNHKNEKGDACSTSNAMHVSFAVNNLMYHNQELTNITDFRVFLFNQNNKMADILNQFTQQQLTILFQNDETYRTTEQCFLDAQQAFNSATATLSDNQEVMVNGKKMTGAERIAQLETALKTAKTNYSDARDNYNKQLNTIEVVNEAKISDFILDNDILNSIPVAFGQNAIRVTEEFIEKLKFQFDLLEAEKAGLEAEITDLGNQLTTERLELEENIVNLDIQITTKRDELYDQSPNSLRAELLAAVNGDEILATEIFIASETVANAFKEGSDRAMALEELLVLILVLIDGFAIDQIDNIERISKIIFNLFIELLTLKAERLTAQERIDYIDSGDTENAQLIIELEKRIKNLEEQIAFLYEELEELASKDNAEKMEDLTKEIAESKKLLAKLKKAKVKDQDQIDEVQNKIDSGKESQKLLGEEIERGAILKAKAEDSDNFTAINLAGDFTDNYGEPLIHNNTYCALVFSVIKSTKPNQIPLFLSNYSKFSDGVKFTLPQL
ncbi:MAG: hypothetical protein AB8H03_11105 [Saprospiraceae bacterium]